MLKEILEEFEKVLMNTYKSDGCITSAITEIHKNQAIAKIEAEYVRKPTKEELVNWIDDTLVNRTEFYLMFQNEESDFIIKTLCQAILTKLEER